MKQEIRCTSRRFLLRILVDRPSRSHRERRGRRDRRHLQSSTSIGTTSPSVQRRRGCLLACGRCLLHGCSGHAGACFARRAEAPTGGSAHFQRYRSHATSGRLDRSFSIGLSDLATAKPMTYAGPSRGTVAGASGSLHAAGRTAFAMDRARPSLRRRPQPQSLMDIDRARVRDDGVLTPFGAPLLAPKICSLSAAGPGGWD
jgi:hypothetical protein